MAVGDTGGDIEGDTGVTVGLSVSDRGGDKEGDN